MFKEGKVWSFQDQLLIGDRGEQLFMERYPKKLVIHPGRDGDFIEVNSGKKIELKTDTYNMDKTENFFIERYSDIHKKTPGSIWQAQSHGCDIFCYMFVRHNIWFQFNNIPSLIVEIERLTHNKGLVYIKNRGFISGGYKIPRDIVSDFYTIWEF